MSDVTLSPVRGALASAGVCEIIDLPGVAPVAPQPDAVDDGLRNYIVFGDPVALALAAPSTKGVRLRGTSPADGPWAATRMTPAEALELQTRGYRVVADAPVTVPTPIPSASAGSRTDLPRAIHEARELNALGAAWEGEGALYISIDTGVAPHRDLPTATHFDDVNTEEPEDPQRDSSTHGTHTTGVAIGRGNPDEGGTRGMAPRAALAAVQVFDANGRASNASVLRAIERAVEWAVEWRREHDGFVVVNMSLGSAPAGDPATDPMVQAIERATTEHGILFTISAGNLGPRAGTIKTPGTAPSAITVGAMDHRESLATTDDRVAWFSSRDREGGTKPNLVADGVGVRSTVPGDCYQWFDGTSDAAPMVGGGAVALGQGLLTMFQRNELRVDPRELVRTRQFQSILAEAALDNPNVPAHVEGAGDLRLMSARELFVQRFAMRNTMGPAPYYRVPF